MHAQPSSINIDSDLTLVDLDDNEDATAETMLIPIDGFFEVPLEIVEARGWVDVASGRWRYRDENVIVLESRALTCGVEILASTQQLFRKRMCGACGQHGRGPQFGKTEITQFLGADMYS